MNEDYLENILRSKVLKDIINKKQPPVDAAKEKPLAKDAAKKEGFLEEAPKEKPLSGEVVKKEEQPPEVSIKKETPPKEIIDKKILPNGIAEEEPQPEVKIIKEAPPKEVIKKEVPKKKVRAEKPSPDVIPKEEAAGEDAPPKDFVKEIFERPKSPADKVSTLFTHLKPPPKVSTSKKVKRPSSLKGLPAAIDIGTSSVKILQLGEAAKGDFEVICIDKEPYSFDKTLPSNVLQKEALKRIIARNKIGPDVVTSISLKYAQIYNLTFPKMSEEEISDAIRWKIAQLRPFGLDAESVVHDFIVWDGLDGAAAQQQVILVCAPKNIVQDIVSLLGEAGLEPVFIEVAPISLAGLDTFRKQASMKDEIVMWLDIGAEESALVIARGDTLYFCRNLAFTSRYMTNQIAQHCRISAQEAETAKQEHGLSFWSPDKKVSVFLEPGQSPQKSTDKSSMVYYSLISSLENLVVDIQHSFKYFSYQVTKSQITRFDRVIISGGGANLKNLERFLSVRLGIPAEKADLFSFFRPSEQIEKQRANLIASPAEFTVCAGLSAGQRIDRTKRIDLAAKEKKKAAKSFIVQLREKPAKVAVLVSTLAVLLICLQIGRAIFYGWTAGNISGNVKGTQAQLSKLQSQRLKLAEEEAELLGKKAILEGKINVLNRSTRRPKDFSRVLAQVASLLPKDVWITNLSYLERKINITGSTSEINLIMQLIETIKSSDKFSDATFNYTQKDPASEVYNFEIIAEVKL